jgi:hypothetical protein
MKSKPPKTKSPAQGVAPAPVVGRQRHRLNNAPYRRARFLRACMHSDKTLSELMEEFAISPATFARWLLRDDFRRALNRVRRYLKQTRELDIELAATRAAAALAQPTTGKGKPAYIDLIKLARDTRARRRHEIAELKSPEVPLIHPAVSSEEASRLLADLQQSHSPTR